MQAENSCPRNPFLAVGERTIYMVCTKRITIFKKNFHKDRFCIRHFDFCHLYTLFWWIKCTPVSSFPGSMEIATQDTWGPIPNYWKCPYHIPSSISCRFSGRPLQPQNLETFHIKRKSKAGFSESMYQSLSGFLELIWLIENTLNFYLLLTSLPMEYAQLCD